MPSTPRRVFPRPSFLSPPLLALAGAVPSIVQAQAPATPATPEACVSINVDADRLACYDATLGRGARDTRGADIAAKEARAIQKNLELAEDVVPEAATAAPTGTGELYPHDDPQLAQAIANAGKGSLLDSRWELAKDSKLGIFNFRAYKPVYLLPVSWTSRSNRSPAPSSETPDNGVVQALDLDKNEAKFQISLKSKIWSLDDHGSLSVWGAYTQSSRWQVYNGRVSRPFRETNYEPELIVTHGADVALPFGWKASMVGLSLNHQSNGRAAPLSRSWNRLIGDLSLEHGETTVSLRPWWRILNGGSDDNPRIQDYVGRGEVLVTQKLGRHVLALTARHSLRFGDRSRGSAQLEWAFPIGGGLHGYLQLFSGYGESLIDYNFRESRVGLGVSVIEWR